MDPNSDFVSDELRIQMFNAEGNAKTVFEKNNSMLIIDRNKHHASKLIKNIIDICVTDLEITECVIVSKTEKYNNLYRNYVNGVIHEDLTDNLIKQILNKDVNEPLLLVFHDCYIKNLKLLEELITNTFHLNIFCVVYLPFPLGLNPSMRQSFDYVYLAYDDVISNCKRLYDHYGGIFPDFNSFRKTHKQICQNGDFLVFKNYGNLPLFDKVKYYKIIESNNTIKSNKIMPMKSFDIQIQNDKKLTGACNVDKNDLSDLYMYVAKINNILKKYDM